MKKVLFALAILPLLAFGSCSSDDDETPDLSDNDFAHNIELLYGQWRATAVEGVGEDVIDLTQPPYNQVVPATYVTFKKDGVYSSEGILGDGTGEYTAIDKTITVAIGEDKENKVSFEMTSLTAEIAKIVIDPSSLDLPIETDGIEEVTVVLTKQEEKK